MSTIAETDLRASGVDVSPWRTFVHALAGFSLSIGLASLVAAAFFALVYVPQMPRTGRIVAITIALFIGVSQVAYLVPIHHVAKRKGASAFCTGIRTGAAVVFLANVAMFVLAAFWPGFND